MGIGAGGESDGLGHQASVKCLQRPEESVQRLHEGQVNIWERLARLEGQIVRERPRLWAPKEWAE